MCHVHRSLVFTPSILNSAMHYGRGGYTVELSTVNITSALTTLQQLRTDFIDHSTRAVALSVTLYSPEMDSLTVCQFLAEFSPTLFVESSATVNTFALLRFGSWRSFFTSEWASLLLAASVLFFFAVEAQEALDAHWQYLASFWNLLEVAQLTFVAVYLCVRWVFGSVCGDRWRHAVDCQGACFVDMQQLSALSQSLYNVAAVSSLLSLFKIFKFLRLNRRMNVMWRTLRLAVWDLLAFSAIISMVRALPLIVLLCGSR
jgi:hypothetical protein